MGKCYNVIIFNSVFSLLKDSKEYAQTVLDVIDPKKICSKILLRKDCTEYNSFFVKDLKNLNVDLKDVVIVDNHASSY